MKWQRGTNVQQIIHEAKPYSQEQNQDVKQIQNFQQPTQKKFITVRSEMIIWLLVRNFFRYPSIFKTYQFFIKRNLQDTYFVKGWFKDEEVCLAGQSKENIEKAHQEIIKAVQTHTMDYIWRSDEPDQLIEQTFSDISVNQDYQNLLSKHPLLLIIKKQKFRKVSLWLKNHGYNGMNKVFPQMPQNFVLVFAPKKEKEQIIKTIFSISSQIKMMLKNNITPGQDQSFDLKGFSNYEFKKSFIYSSQIHRLSKIQIICFCLDQDIKLFSEQQEAYLEFSDDSENKEQLLLQIHSKEMNLVSKTQKLMFDILAQRSFYLIKQGKDGKIDQEKQTIDLKTKFHSVQGQFTFFKQNQIIEMSNAFDQFYEASTLEEVTQFLAQYEAKDSDTFIFVNQNNQSQILESIQMYPFDCIPQIQEKNCGKNLYISVLKEKQLSKNIAKSFHTPTNQENQNEFNDKDYLRPSQKKQYLIIQKQRGIHYEVVYFNRESDYTIQNFIFNGEDFDKYMQLQTPGLWQVKPMLKDQRLSFLITIPENHPSKATKDDLFFILETLDIYINSQLLYFIKSLNKAQKNELMNLQQLFDCNILVNEGNWLVNKKIYYQEDMVYTTIKEQVENSNNDKEKLIQEVDQKNNPNICLGIVNLGYHLRQKLINQVESILNAKDKPAE